MRTAILLVICLVLSGCGGQDTGPSVEELVRRQKQREKDAGGQQKTPEQRIESAKEFLAQGNTASAESELRALLIAQPNNPKVVMLTAQCSAASGHKLEAVEILNTIDADDEANIATALSLSAQWLVDEKEFDAAQEKLEQLLKLPGDQTRAHRRLARLFNSQGRRREAAIHLFALARSGEITEKELFAMTNYGDAFIDTSIEKPDFKTKLIPAALAEAKRLQSDGELTRARDLAEKLAKAFPTSTQIMAFQGRIHSELHEDDKVKQWAAVLPAGIECEPEYWFAVGLWMQRQARHREAIRCFGEAVLRDQTDLYSYSALGRSLTALGEFEAGRQFANRFELIDEAMRLATRIGYAKGAQRELNRLADLLEQLRRPWEAIAWRNLAAKVGGANELEIEKLGEQRAALLAQGDVQDVGFFLTCGVDISHYPLPDLGQLQSSIATQNELPNSRFIAAGRIELIDVAGQVGLDFQYDNGDDPSDESRLLHQLTGGGIGVIDIDLDGYFDLYFTQGGGAAFDPLGSKPNQFFRNIAGKLFINQTAPTLTGDTGYGQGVAVADINQDGFADLLVANLGPNILYLNNGDGTFTRQVLVAPNKSGEWTSSIACGDLSGDQLPEIVEVNYINDPSAVSVPCTSTKINCNPSEFQSAPDHVWQVKPDGTIVTWEGCQQMAEKPNYGFGAILANFDLKPGNELFIANDTGLNHLWVEQQVSDPHDRTLIEGAQLYGCADGLVGQRQGCMGIAHGDFDRNGRLDLHVTNFWNQSADLYLQQSSGLFVNGTASHGLFEPSLKTVAWGTQAADFDRDGWLDLAVLNGHLIRRQGQPFKMRPQLFRGAMHGFHLQEPTSDGLDYWGKAAQGRTMALVDWNHDGKPDLVTNHLDVPASLLENRTLGGNSLQLELVGTVSERDAIGAIVTVTCGDQSWTEWMVGGDGFLCSNEPVLDVGVGNAIKVDKVVVQWPSGATQEFNDLAVKKRYLLIENDESLHQRE